MVYIARKSREMKERYKAVRTGVNTWNVYDTDKNCSISKSVSPQASYNEAMCNMIVRSLNSVSLEAEKIVSERLREELTDWADYWNKLATGHACIMKEDIDEYLKSREQ
jgi:oligoendopeptidase F